MKRLVLIKIGGGLITDKTKSFTTRPDMMDIAAAMISDAVTKYPDSAFLVGNGAGSFGHYLASKEVTVDTDNARNERIRGIHESVLKLNSIFLDHLKAADLDAVTVIPAENLKAKDGVVTNDSFDELIPLFESSKVPALFGDILDDNTPKGLILSTEDLLQVVAERMQQRFDEIHVIYAGETEGVLDGDGHVIPEISETAWQDMGHMIYAPPGYDVTGGMLHKIESALKIAEIAKSVHVISGKEPQNISTALSGGRIGTKIVR